VALQVDVKDIAACADSVMFCISKGLCAPVGSLICGSHDFIKQAKRNRKLLGGGMRQVGFLVACGLISLNDMTKRLELDHELACYLAKMLHQMPYIELDESKVQINMVFFKINQPDFDHNDFYEYLLSKGIKINPVDDGFYRFVTHNDISKADVDLTLKFVSDYLLKTPD